MGHLQDVMLKSDTLRRSKDHWEVDGIFAFCYKVSREANCGLLNQNIHLKIGTRLMVNSKHLQYLVGVSLCFSR